MKNGQWQVTNYGVESIVSATTPRYDFAADRLLETTDRHNGTFYDWPVHMAEKDWVDIEAFIEAFQAALAIHAEHIGAVANPTMLETSLLEARRIAREDR